MDTFDFILSLIETYLPAPWGGRVLPAAIIITTLFSISVATERIIFHKRLFIRNFSDPPTRTSFDGVALANELRKRMQEIWALHRKTRLRSASEVTALGNPRRLSENLGSQISMYLVSKSPIGFLPDLVGKFLPRFELEGEGVVIDNMIAVNSRLKNQNKVLKNWPAKVEAAIENVTMRVAQELAYRIVLDTSRGDLFRKGTNVGTTKWQALRAHTEALSIWQAKGFEIDKAEDVERVDAKLSESIEHDPEYPLAYYNRGTLVYMTFRSAQSNEQARKYFLKAAQIARAANKGARKEGRFEDRRVEGLAWVGVSRCYSQDYHRYGRTEQEVVNEARDAAKKALNLLGRDARSLYASAFAWHCTETLEDIRKGRPLYEEILAKEIGKLPVIYNNVGQGLLIQVGMLLGLSGKYPVVHNNLGYILMVGGELLKADGKDREAQDWWKQAQRHMEMTIKADRPRTRLTDFAYANLGNLHRLRANYEQAIEAYRQALGGDPDHSKYTDGLNELARVYFDEGKEPQNALKYHSLALYSTEDRDHRLKLMGQAIDILRLKNHPNVETIEAIHQKMSDLEKPPDTEAWLEELARHLDIQ
jgi:tetratricopeptide (TPR) repeat protein